MLRAEAHVGVGGEMKDELGALHGARQRLRVEQVALDEAEIRVRRRALEKAHPAGRQIVVADDGVAVGEQTIDQIASDEAGCSGDKIGHHVTRSVLIDRPRKARALCQSPIRNTPFTTPVVIRTTPHAIDIASVSFIVRLPAAPSVLAMAISRPPQPM